jgi:hypothetical protein
MWIIFHDSKSIFTHVDKNVFALVEDKDILEFQTHLAARLRAQAHTVVEQSDYLQNFVGNDYFARRYLPMTPRISKIVPPEPPKLEIPRASLFRDVELQSPCSTGR